MSKGSPKIIVRLPGADIRYLTEVVRLRNLQPNITCRWTLSDWIRAAIVEKLDKGRRGNPQRKKSGAAPLS